MADLTGRPAPRRFWQARDQAARGKSDLDVGRIIGAGARCGVRRSSCEQCSATTSNSAAMADAAPLKRPLVITQAAWQLLC